MSLGFVTSFVDPFEDLKRTEGRSSEVYLRLFQELHRGLPLPLVVRVCPRHVDAVRSIIATNHVLAERSVVEEPFLTARNVERLRTIQDLAPMANHGPTKDTREFAVACYGKTDAIVDSLDLLGTSHVGWIDFGIAHIAELPTLEGWWEIERNVPDVVKVVQMLGTSERETTDLRSFYEYNRGRIDAGFMTGSRTALIEHRDLMNEELERMTLTGRYVLEEQLTASLTARKPDLFDFCFADYAGALVNYVHVRRDIGSVIRNLEHSRSTGDHANGTRILETLLRSTRTRSVQLNEHEWAVALSEGYVCAYYAKRELADEIAALTSALYAYGHAWFRQMVDATNLRSNIRFSGEELDEPSWTWEQLSARDDLHAWGRCL